MKFRNVLLDSESRRSLLLKVQLKMLYLAQPKVSFARADDMQRFLQHDDHTRHQERGHSQHQKYISKRNVSRLNLMQRFRRNNVRRKI